MKVLMMVSWYSKKDADVMIAGVFHYEQSMALKKYCDVRLYYPFDAELDKPFVGSEEKGLYTYRTKMSRSRIFRILNIIRDFRRIKKEYNPDILHAHVAGMAGKFAVILSKIYKIPLIVTEHNPIELSNLDNARQKKNTGNVYRNSCANICVSSDSAARLKEIFTEAEFEVIHNGIINPANIETDGITYRQDGKINCSIVASFYSRDIKGYQYLLPAIKEVKDKGYDIVLHICGGGEFFEEYVQMSKDLGIEDNCVFYGNCDRQKVYSIMKQMDFGISASIFECSGVSVQEMMLVGKPLVVTRSGGANSLVTEDTAIVVDRHSTGALRDGIIEMIEKLDKFDADTITQYAYNNFEIDMVSKAYMKKYREIVGNSRE